MATRLMTKAERRHWETFPGFAPVNFEALKRSESEKAIVRAYVNDYDTDIVLYFGKLETDEATETFARVLEVAFQKAVWDSDGPFEHFTDDEIEEADEESEDDE